MWSNKLKLKLLGGETVYGTFIRLPGPIPVELAARAGFDFVVVDLEHGALTLADLQTQMIAGYAADITPLVRVPDHLSESVYRILDQGAQGVMVPQVETEEQARQAAEASKFQPVGRRGQPAPSRGNGWGALTAAESMARCNREVLTIVQIESEEALANLEAIARQPGIDMLFVGPIDLSASLGVPGQPDHHKVVEATLKVISAAQRFGKLTGIHTSTAEQAAFWKVHGVNLMTAGLDTVTLQQGFARVMEGLRPG